MMVNLVFFHSVFFLRFYSQVYAVYIWDSTIQKICDCFGRLIKEKCKQVKLILIII